MSRVGPHRTAWLGPLSRMLEEASKYRSAAEAWYRERGKAPPPDPSADLVKLAEDAAKGGDVARRLRDAGLVADEPPPQPDDPRYP